MENWVEKLNLYMKANWTDLNDVSLYGDVSVYSALGLATILLAVFNIGCYMVAAIVLWRATHKITKVLKHKIIMDACLAGTTVLMGIAGYTDAPQWFWQVSYICRVGLLLIAPLILYRVVAAFLTIIRTFQHKL